jgi:hypothetical protein
MSLNQIKIIGAIIVLILIGFVVERYATRKTSPEPDNQINFIHDGNLIINNPGLKSGVWYLSYEEPGKSALSVELKLADQNMDLQSGMRARVEGFQSGNVVQVSKLDVLNAYKTGLIWLDTPRPNDMVISPITLHGYAKGNWYFEATFPVKALDSTGKVLAQTTAQAQGNWMVDTYVEFIASLTFTNPSVGTGTLVLEKDNPSDLPQNANELRIPIKLGTEGRAVKLYYYNPNKDKDAQGNILASRKGLVAVDRQIPISITPIQDTVRLLLQGSLTQAEKALGITTEYPLPGVELKSADLKNGVLTLEFADPQNRTGGGSARVGVLWFQIEATAKQFPEVKDVKFKPAELFQP